MLRINNINLSSRTATLGSRSIFSYNNYYSKKQIEEKTNSGSMSTSNISASNGKYANSKVLNT